MVVRTNPRVAHADGFTNVVGYVECHKGRVGGDSVGDMGMLGVVETLFKFLSTVIVVLMAGVAEDHGP